MKQKSNTVNSRSNVEHLRKSKAFGNKQLGSAGAVCNIKSRRSYQKPTMATHEFQNGCIIHSMILFTVMTLYAIT